ncbi:hypothetical protein scyTo_0008538 [Scyliorhinus torazame]|uniref:guanylate cyclase n=1 Tax=Scyliorhinus torazame TaxID=75743 RepID=A0A401PAZ4_SCYTO|nr:hypothetical protein [Scyliorhinus torazame]
MAAKLAVDRINKGGFLHHRYKLDYVVLQDDCQTSKALSNFVEFEKHASVFLGPANPGYCEAASLMGKNWNKGIFSWACVNFQLDNANSYPTFARTLLPPVRVLYNVMKYFLWAHIGIISSNENIWVDTANKVANALRYNGLPVGIVTSMGFTDEDIVKTLMKIRNVPDLRIIIMCMHSVLIGGEEQAVFLQKAHEMGLTDGRFVFVPYDTLLYSLPHKNVSYSVLRNNSQLRSAYDAVLTVTMASEEMDFYEALIKAQENGEIATSQQPEQVSPLFGTIYNGVYFIAKTMESVQRDGRHISGITLANYTKNLKFVGFNQKIETNSRGEGIVNYVILDTDGRSHHLSPTYTIDMATETVEGSGKTIHFPGGSPPHADSSCWFDPNATCTGGIELTVVLLAFGFIIALALCGLGLTYVIRRRIQQIQMVKGPNKIIMTLEDLTFINPQLSKKKITLDELSDGRSISERKSLKSGMHSLSGKSLTAVNHENSNVALYEGDWVWLKKFNPGSLCDVQKATTKILKKMRDLRNENVNPFLGFLCDSGVLAIATEHCSRGSLHDLLRNDDVKLDWMFKSSLLLDLIKGMKYLHHRDFAHGRLKSQNCLVDGRFVLKIADYGYLELLETQKASREKPPPEELFWTAPEFLRDSELSKKATMKGDSYSFAIILQEVVVRGAPYCMLGLSPGEIIRKVKKPPPMCRPTVSPDQAPLECIQLMKQCWSELPERRPTFNEIFDRFKTINKGKKTNIIDSMLRMLEQYSSNLEDLIRERTDELEVEKQKTEKLLSQMLPPSVAEALKMGGNVEPEYFDQVTVYFSDIVGFTTISALSEPIQVIDLLNDLYTLFDAVLGNHDVYKNFLHAFTCHEKIISVRKEAHESLGMTVSGGLLSKGWDLPIYVTHVLPDGCLGNDGRIKNGDILLDINGIELTGMTQSEAVSIIKHSAASSSVVFKALELRVAEKDNVNSQMPLNANQNSLPEDDWSPSWNMWLGLPRYLYWCKDIGLRRNTSGSLGFSIVGGYEENYGSQPFFIKSIVYGLPAYNDGRLRCGDMILAVNGRSTSGISHPCLVKMLKEARGKVMLTVASWPGSHL